MVYSRFAALFLALASVLCGFQEVSVVDRIIEEERARSEVMAHLDHLVNKIGPRLTSSDRLTQACEWAKTKFEGWGLKNCRLEEWGTFPVGFNRGPWSGKMVEPESMSLTFTTSSWTPGTKGPVTAEAILGPTNDEELEAVREKLGGKWILSPGASTGRDFNDKLRAEYDKAGVLGLIRSGGKVREDEVVHTGGSQNVSWDKLPTRASITLLKSQFDRIRTLLKEGKAVKLTFDIKNEFKKGPIPLYNVLAEIPGSEKPDEMVIVGGHIDSWDGATGTTDNGTGTCTTLEAARLLMKAGAKPKRTIRFMLWSGEEQGLLGSRAYVQKHPEENPKISGVLVHDMGTQYVSGISATKPMMPIFEKVFERVVTLNPEMPFKVREVAGLSGGGSDHSSYLAAGVPGFFWNQAGDKAHYPRTHHTQLDTYDAAVKDYQEHTSMVVAIAAYNIANLDALLPREGLVARGGGRRMLGVNLDEDTAVLSEIIDGTPAAKAGLKVGDKVLKLGNRDVKDGQTLREAIQEAPQKTKIKIRRGDKELELDVQFDQPPPGGARRTLGISLEDDGMTISAVEDGRPAQKAGLKAGDRILRIGTTDVKDFDTLAAAIREAPRQTKVRFRRGDREQEVEVTFDR